MPKRQRRVVLAGQQLLDALAKTQHPVKWCEATAPLSDSLGKAILLTPAQAACIVRSGLFVGVTSPLATRVYYIRETDKREIEANPTYWDDRAVLRYADDAHGHETKRKRKLLADLWDRMLKRNPPPKNWRRKKTP